VSVAPQVANNKRIGSYSTQDSRRKSQAKYYAIERNGRQIEANRFNDLNDGDIFNVKRFVSPGVYSATKKQDIPFDPHWAKVEIRRVQPLTRYVESDTPPFVSDYVEIIAYQPGEKDAIVMGNIPLALLVEQNDYLIPSFGVGLFLPSEQIERRYLRVKDGPAPHYAYQMTFKDKQWRLVNNHESGIEQIALRPFSKDGRLYLRITFIAYERILDLLELEVPLSGTRLATIIEQSTENYQPPLYSVYEDNNLI
jgi:hypothetical protein